MALYGSGIEPSSPKWESYLWGVTFVDGKIFSCHFCSWAIRVEYKYSVLVPKWSTCKPFDHCLTERGCCHACYKREQVFFENNKRNAQNLKTELQILRSTSEDRFKLRVLGILKQVVAALTLVDIQQAIGLPIDVSFGDCHASPKKRLGLVKAFVQQHSQAIEKVIRKRLLVEGSINQMFIQHKRMVLPKIARLKSLMKWELELKKTNAPEGGLTYEGFTKPVVTASAELFYGHPGVDANDSDGFNLSLYESEYVLSTVLNKALYYEVMERLTHGEQGNVLSAKQC